MKMNEINEEDWDFGDEGTDPPAPAAGVNSLPGGASSDDGDNGAGKGPEGAEIAEGEDDDNWDFGDEGNEGDSADEIQADKDDASGEGDTAENEQDENGEADEDYFAKTNKILESSGFWDGVDAPSSVDEFEEALDKKIEKDFEEFLTELDDDAKAFLKYKRAGGATSKFFDTVAKGSPADFPDTEAGKAAKVTQWLTQFEGFSSEDAKELVEGYMESGLIDKFDKIYTDKWNSHIKVKQEELVAKSKIDKENALKEIKALKSSLNDAFRSEDFRLKYGLTTEDNKKLPSMLTEATVEVSGKPVTPFIAKLTELYTKSPEKLLVLAKIIDNDFDLSFLEKKAVTKATVAAKTAAGLQKTKQEREKKTRSTPERLQGVWNNF